MLHIGTTGSDAPFLAEKDLPEYARLSGEREQALSPRHSAPASDPAQEIADRELAEALAESSRLQEQQGSQGDAPGLPLTQSTASGASSSSSPAVGSGASAFPESAISSLLASGFSREASLAALREANGDANLALLSLFAKSIGSAGQ